MTSKFHTICDDSNILTLEDLLKLSKALFKVGVGAFCPTLYPGSTSEMIKKLKSFSSVMGKEKGARIIGFHLEGPFLSPQKPGVMKPSDIKEIDISLIEKLYKINVSDSDSIKLLERSHRAWVTSHRASVPM